VVPRKPSCLAATDASGHGMGVSGPALLVIFCGTLNIL
jgi:hypothetical protein